MDLTLSLYHLTGTCVQYDQSILGLANPPFYNLSWQHEDCCGRYLPLPP